MDAAASSTLLSTVPPGLSAVSLRPYAMRMGLWGTFAVLALIGAFTPNGLVTSAALAVVPLLVMLLWRNGEPPVLLFGCMMQWLQATAAIFYTNHFGLTLDEAFGSPELTVATWLSLTAVVVLAIGIRCGFIFAGASQMRQLELSAAGMDIGRIGFLYAVSVVVAALLNFAAWRLTSITQLLLALASLKWAIVFLLCYTVIHQRRRYGMLFVCVAVEFGMGLFGIFSTFKSVFFVLLIAVLSSSFALRGRRLAATLVCFVILFFLGVVWSAIKTDYRGFLLEETSGPEDVIPIEKKFDKLADLLESFTWDNFADGLDALILRVSYVNFFALAIENVPSRMPYENGALWQGSIMHVLTPRILFPDKPVLDDSERTQLYTGVQVAGSEQGTSIGIGYVGESYIDYGPVWMFAPIFLLGLLYGLINRFFITRTRYKLLGSALAVAILIFSAYEIEISNIKLVGGVVSAALVMGSVYLIAARSLTGWLQLPTRAK